ncbi:MAG: pancreas/duodenum homeobox protein 1 [Candidatus Magnetomorum sp.]|nr:pancreas/duodenum homeobox protein 1 [Candidatus Magnetomorum sp.]
MISSNRLDQIFNSTTLDDIFPPERADLFFDALLGDATEGAYDIRLIFQKAESNILRFAFELHERPGKCLVCSLTYGLPHVFSRHPVINVKNIVDHIQEKITEQANITGWSLDRTIQLDKTIHVIPLLITLDHPIAL